jgi:hypothetical protein
MAIFCASPSLAFDFSFGSMQKSDSAHLSGMKECKIL